MVHCQLRHSPRLLIVAINFPHSRDVIIAAMNRFVAADASPLIGLAIAGAFDLLRELYGTLTITRLVKDEITARADLPGAPELETAMREGWIRVAPTPLDTWKLTQIDAGEASTIALACEHEQALLLMDDKLGCEHASALGLQTTGLMGVLPPRSARGSSSAFGRSWIG